MWIGTPVHGYAIIALDMYIEKVGWLGTMIYPLGDYIEFMAKWKPTPLCADKYGDCWYYLRL